MTDASSQSEFSSQNAASTALASRTLSEIAVRLEISTESATIQTAFSSALRLLEQRDEIADDRLDGKGWEHWKTAMVDVAASLGIRLSPVVLTPQDAWDVLQDDFTLAVLEKVDDGPPISMVCGPVAMGQHEVTTISGGFGNTAIFSRSNFMDRVTEMSSPFFFMAQPLLACGSMASQTGTNAENNSHSTSAQHVVHGDAHAHVSPQRRFLSWLKLESRDIWPLLVFGFVVSVLDLATPLAVEQMVTSIGYASFAQPLIWLSILIFGILLLSAMIKGLQFFMIEILQRRLFVRIVGDLAERIPRIEQSSIEGTHGPELANRFFDVMTMQKAVASLLIDGLSLVIQTITGLLLLALYSPYLLAFDVVLILCMTLFLWVLGRNAVTTSIEESYVKYKIAKWLQDMIGNPVAFQLHGGAPLAIDRANRLTVDYLVARRKHFIILIRQTLFSLFLYAVSISSLLSLGGWLVISSSISMGQLVASVSVVAVVVGAFSKVGKSLESFYDLMSATDKVGHLIDLETLPPRHQLPRVIDRPANVRIRGLIIQNAMNQTLTIGDLSIDAGRRFGITGAGTCGKSQLMSVLCGLNHPLEGVVEIDGIDSRDANGFIHSSMTAIATEVPQVFGGSFRENVTLNRSWIDNDTLRQALELVELWDEVLMLKNGLDAPLQTGGYPLSVSQIMRLSVARAIVGSPQLLLIDGVLDRLPRDMRDRIWNRLSSSDKPWTLVVVSHDSSILSRCDAFQDLSIHVQRDSTR